MKGLLHRLVARATGTMVALRSDARLPFGDAHLGWGEIDDIDGRSEPPVMAKLMNLAVGAIAQPDGSMHAAPVPLRDGRSAARSADHRAEQQSGASPAAPHSRQATEDLSRDATARPRVGDGAGDAAAQLPPRPRQPMAFRSNGPPALLVPEVAPERLAQASDRSDAARGLLGPNAGSPPAEEPAEVHVHIGRIEVMVAQEAPPPRKTPSRKHAPMSLDAYLAARSRR